METFYFDFHLFTPFYFFAISDYSGLFSRVIVDVHINYVQQQNHGAYKEKLVPESQAIIAYPYPHVKRRLYDSRDNEKCVNTKLHPKIFSNFQIWLCFVAFIFVPVRNAEQK